MLPGYVRIGTATLRILTAWHPSLELVVSSFTQYSNSLTIVQKVEILLFLHSELGSIGKWINSKNLNRFSFRIFFKRLSGKIVSPFHFQLTFSFFKMLTVT